MIDFDATLIVGSALAALCAIAAAVFGLERITRLSPRSTDVRFPPPPPPVELVLERQAEDERKVHAAAAASGDPFGAVAELGRQDRVKR